MESKMPNLPHKNQITFRWILDHVPLSWWMIVFTSLMGVFSAGFMTAKLTLNTLDGDILDKISAKERLQSDIQNLESKKASLNTQIIILEVKRDGLEMTTEERKERLRSRINLSQD
ncbi:hypothetical protein QWY20_13020 [Alkalimonas sp. MEB108]|uniref:Uncharacterized protein n=1 Tax=Alkalimonas cellulosilytica TaxID=3058395 RepID=A0ABU7J785_9GAMM|nr:hypothetical protein [Alkalimonas sp. MEB108]MEE2002378.1 hypothetical protein [Alkalimonas sp. MEB108]